MIKKVFLNTAAQIIGKVITASATLLITVIIGRSLGPEGYGDFTKIFTFIGYFYIFADFGLNAAYIKLTREEKESTLFSSLISLRLILALILAITAIIISQFLPYDSTTGTGFGPLTKVGIIIASVTILTQAILTSFNAFFQKQLRYDLSTIAVIFGTLTTLAATLAISLRGAHLNMYVAAYVLGGIATVICARLLIAQYLKANLKISTTKESFLKFLHHSWPVGTALIFNLIYFRMDIFILSYTRPPREVGIYGLAYQFFEASLSIPIFFANALFPLLVNLHEKDKRNYSRETKKWAFILLAISILHTIALIAASFLIPLLFGKFQGAQGALIILSLGMPFFFVSALFWHLLIVKDRQKLLIPAYLIGGTVNLVLNLFLIPVYGYIAASAVTVLSEALIALILLIFLKAKADATISGQHLVN